MRVGIHLPQFGRASGPDAIRRAARHAEDLGFAGLWVSDHVVSPVDQPYPSPYLFDPLLTLGWAAAATERIEIGTSVIVVPQHPPLWLANALASLDALSGGRLVLGAGVGWSAAEFAALGMGFADRGRRCDEILQILRACWEQDPVTHHGEHYRFEDIRVLPKPARRIPIWVGGASEPAYRRAIRYGDGFHAIGLSPEEAEATVARIRRDAPDESFTVSLRTGWDPQGMELGRITEERARYEEAGIQYVVAAPWRSSLDEWLASMDQLAELVGLPGAPQR